MNGWSIGDLALCVDDSDSSHLVVTGCVYRVMAVKPEFLDLEGVFGLGLHSNGMLTTRFRKILPDAHEDCEPEFVVLMNRIKRPAKQGEPA